MNFLELQVTFAFCLMFLLRMLGMFMMIPVISHYGILLPGSTPLLIGLAMGIYGISQIIFQIPFGILSDRFNRKFIVLFGLFLFFIGNIFSASMHSILGLIIGRFLQGSGAISGVLMALLSDLIREKNRHKSIAAIGVSFALSFLIAMILGPILAQNFGFFSIFWITAFLSIICIFIFFFFIPNIQQSIENKKTFFNQDTLLYCFNKNFIRHYLSVFFLHFFLVVNFMIIPHKLELLNFPINQHWKLYFFTIFISFIILFFVLFFLKIKFLINNIIEISIALMFLADIIFLKKELCLIYVFFSIQIFFIAFNFLEVFLPSSLSKTINRSYKGSVMSIYATSQFLGIFLGGIFSGILLYFFHIEQVVLFELLLIFIWFTIIIVYKK